MQYNNITLKTIFVLTLVSLYIGPLEAIVNMDDLHFKQHRQGLSGSVNFQASSSSGNTDSSNVSFANQLQWNSQKHINLLVLGYEYGETNDERTLNKSFVHGRHVRNISDNLDYEFFAQLEENEFTRLTYRGLFGTGLRVPFADSDNHIAYLGLGGFREVEKIEPLQGTAQAEISRTGRWNIYLMSRYKLDDRISFSNTVYWQPRMADSADRRALFVSILSLKTTRQFSFQFSYESVYDSQPPIGVEKKDAKIKTGIVYSF